MRPATRRPRPSQSAHADAVATITRPIAPGALAGARTAARRRRVGIEPYLYLLPAIASIALWIYWPLATTLELSFYQWNLLPTTPKVFVGLANYERVLTLPEIRAAVLNTVLYIVGLLPFSIVVPLAVALLVAEVGQPMRNLYRAIVFVPVLVAPVVVAVLWRWIMHPLQGVLNLALGTLFGVAPINWLNDPTTAIWALVNTFLMASLVTVAQLLTAILAAFAFARWRFRGDRLLSLLFVGTWLVPFQVVMIPNYVRLAQLGWLNTMAALVVPQLASAFAVILLRQHMKAFPRELIEAAQIYGASNWRILWGLVVPNMRAPLAALGILLFISTWNEYFWPLLVIRRIESSVVQVGLQMFLTQEGDQWGPLMAAANLATLAVLAIYVVLQRQVVDAFVRSGIK
jgi:sn-glycerol 3-phosphate transport system permease protein